MANISNNFLKGKMNKDLDARLLQNGEYRNAINASISKSEGANVGALENVLGNSLVTDFNTLTGATNLKSIGYLTDEINNTVYVFLTSNELAIFNTAVDANYIISYNALQGPTSAVILVQGAFLNFSQLNPIYGVNILENLLFWTDNRNQPRKINVVSALGLNYYTTEDQISVAKYNPYQPIEFFQKITSKETTANPLLLPAVDDYQTTMFDVSSKAYPDGGSATSTSTNPLATATGLSAPILINANTAQGNVTTGDKVYYLDTNGVLIDTGKVVVTAPTIAVPSFTTDADITAYVVAGTLLFVFNANPYYEDDFSGDSEFLKDKFVRFSYRFQFDDNEYSIFAPFTQPAFIPEQDGYFRYNKDWTSATTNITDEEDTYRSTIVDFMENKVTKILLNIPLPTEQENLVSKFKVTSIDILYKESDALAVKVIDTINAPFGDPVAKSTDILTYEYNSKKPFKTLPSDEITRVFDKVPVRAFSQEISANRVIYGNFQTKHTPPATIDYSVNVAEKEDNTADAATPPGSIESKVSKLEYPSSTLKQNRTYQVGVVLSDRFGRQSTVILSSQDSTVQSGGNNFGGSTTFTAYLDETVDKVTFPGNALRVLFNQPIGPDSPNTSTGWPGIYNDDTTDTNYNPLGWYSYKIVVKQQEQEYYNVYLPGVLAAYPDDKELELGKTSHTVLINDNINKVPRDLVEVGPTQKQFRSSVDLNGRVENQDSSPTSQNSRFTNKQFYPTKAGDVVSTIASDDDLFNGENTLVNFIPSQAFYSIDSNPFIARISTTKQFGVTNTNITRTTLAQATPDSITINVIAGTGAINPGDTVTGGTIVPGTIVTDVVTNSEIEVNKKQTLVAGTTLNFHKGSPIRNLQNLAVFETDPVLSELDIFWETSSSGLITDLNQAIIDDSAASASIDGFNDTNFTEAIVPGFSAPPESSLTTAGTLYDPNSFTVTGGTAGASGLTGTIDTITGGGATGPIATYTITNQGNGLYQVGDVLTIVQPGASGGTITITAINVNPLLGIGNFTLQNQASVDYPYGTGTGQGILTLVSVFDLNLQDRSDEFVLNDNNTIGVVGVYSVGVKGNASNPYYYYGFPTEARSFRFLFRSVVNSIIQEFYEDVELENLVPVITGCVASVTPTGGNGTAFSTIAELYAVNGSAYGLKKATDLTWTLTEAAGNNYFNISTSVVNNYPTAGNNALKAVITVNGFGGDPPNRTYGLRASVSDAGNLTAACIFNVVINVTVCQFLQSSAANPTPDYDPTVPGQANAQGNQYQFKADWTNCSGGAETVTLDADGVVFCRQALGSAITWELLLPTAAIPTADRTGVFNAVVSSCGSGPNP